MSGSYFHARFIERPNRFLARVRLDDGNIEGSREKSIAETHLPDPGRLRELLLPNAKVILRESNNPHRKTRYSLIGVLYHDVWVNVDSQIPNRLFRVDFRAIPGLEGYKIIRSEFTYHRSRFDFLMENPNGKKTLIEIKGVTLVEDNLALFPDAPTVRGTRHIHELERAIEDGYEAAVVFFIKRSDATAFQPNNSMDPRFSTALLSAIRAGVRVYPVRCHFDPIERFELNVLDLVPFQAPKES
ncbi:MAG: DNA/RNA nuclease SfsA [Candidatus Thorarchaeota archaeon]